MKISRRDFLKLSGYGMLGAALPRLSLFGDNAGVIQGRIVDSLIWSYQEPNRKSGRKKAYWRDLIVPITNTTVDDDESAYNRVWYQVENDGYVYSGSVQPVKTILNEPRAISLAGALGEVSVPFADAHLEADAASEVVYRLYYESTHWVTASAINPIDGQIWYALLDDKFNRQYYAPGKYIRLLSEGELAPLSSDVPNAEKLVKVNLNGQLMMAYERSRLVYATRVSTGGRLRSGTYTTPVGEYLTYHKRPTRHMAAGDLAASGFDLPGVPWVIYIKENGISFHGTYWHNDYGRPRSHGCINMTAQAAKWLYRWTIPTVSLEKELIYGRVGTRVEIEV